MVARLASLGLIFQRGQSLRSPGGTKILGDLPPSVMIHERPWAEISWLERQLAKISQYEDALNKWKFFRLW